MYQFLYHLTYTLKNIPSFQGSLRQKLQLNLAIGMFIAREINFARAAEYAEIGILEFAELLNGFGFSVLSYSDGYRYR